VECAVDTAAKRSRSAAIIAEVASVIRSPMDHVSFLVGPISTASYLGFTRRKLVSQSFGQHTLASSVGQGMVNKSMSWDGV
jgi:hypothetical protein